jgi:translation initiation factor 2 subunit 3
LSCFFRQTYITDKTISIEREVIGVAVKKSGGKRAGAKRPTAKKPELTPEVNIGLIGHVDHGKTTLTQALSGKWTDTHSEEMRRGITIRLGYADAVFYECPKCRGSDRFGATPKCIKCFSEAVPARMVSFVDAPGHETLMATVLSGAALMDGALLIIAANEPCPQPQTAEHLTALDMAGIKKVVVVQNKIDLVSEEEATKNYRQIRDFLRGTMAEKAPVVPVSAQQGINIDALIGAIQETIPTPKRDLTRPARMLVARSFDVNRPGTGIKDLRGGVLGGSLVQGELRVGDSIEIRPGIRTGEKFEPVTTKVTGLQKAAHDIEKSGPGGLLGVSTELDPFLSKSDSLAGDVAGPPGTLPPVLAELELKVSLLERVVGTKERLKVEEIRTNDVLMITAGTARTVGTVSSATPGRVKAVLRIPVCAGKGGKVALSRQVSGRWRLVGWGEIL